MKKIYTTLFLSLTMFSLAACTHSDAALKTTKSTATTTKSEESSTSTTQSSASSASSSSSPQTVSSAASTPTPPETSAATYEADPAASEQIAASESIDQTPAPVVESAPPTAPSVDEQPQAPAVESQPTNDWMSEEQRAALINGGQFDPNFVDSLSQADYQLAADRAHQRLAETGYGDVSTIWYELNQMYPGSTTVFDTPAN